MARKLGLRELRWMLGYARRAWSNRRWKERYEEWQRFWSSYRDYAELEPEVPLLASLYPCPGDDVAETPIEPVYFYQDTWGFDRIVSASPTWHVDVGSHHLFVAFLSKVVPVTMIDIRPLSLPLASLKFKQGSITCLPFEDGSVPSLSSLCVIEHIGLGRYGDDLDPRGSEKAITELRRVSQPGGDLYLSVPINDRNRIYFNAHRAFSEEYMLRFFDDFDLIQSRYIYGKDFLDERRAGFGIGCYHLRRSTT